MEIIVEIGTDEQKELITNEIRLFYDGFGGDMEIGDLLKTIIIPNNFEEACRDRTTSDFMLNRPIQGHSVQAKYFDELKSILLSPLIYTEGFNDIIRGMLYCHEFSHCILKKKMKKLTTTSNRDMNYYMDLTVMFEEYYANRFSYEIMGGIKYEKNGESKFKSYVIGFMNSYHKSLMDNAKYDSVRHHVVKFKVFKYTIEELISAINPYIDGVTKDLAYFFACADYFGGDSPLIEQLSGCKFYNDDTINLINYIRETYDNNAYDITDGLNLYRKYLENFGISYRDTDNGLYIIVEFI